jgi:hypothetical protein
VLQHIYATSAASSGFDQPSMIALASSRILELGPRLWKGCRPTAEQCAPSSPAVLLQRDAPMPVAI